MTGIWYVLSLGTIQTHGAVDMPDLFPDQMAQKVPKPGFLFVRRVSEKLRNSCLILIIFDTKIPDII